MSRYFFISGVETGSGFVSFYYYYL
jgi:hypothetical protein